MTDQQVKQLQLEVRCGHVFSPSAPINKLSLFAGRLPQIHKLRDAINSRGCHAILFGERGVGKTSLVSILKELFAGIPSLQIVKTNCVESDDFQNAWRKALAEIEIYVEKRNGALLLTDDGYTISDLESSGMNFETEKRKAHLGAILNGFGVRLEERHNSGAGWRQRLPFGEARGPAARRGYHVASIAND